MAILSNHLSLKNVNKSFLHFWGAERKFWQQKGVYSTAVGYIGGNTENPTYKEVSTGLTGHAEAVLVVYDPEVIAFSQLLPVFFNAHNPTQGMRQGNDIGSQYRSGIYTFTDIQQKVAEFAKRIYDKQLSEAGLSNIITSIRVLLCRRVSSTVFS